MIIKLPPGIGDIYWVLQKLSSTGRKFDYQIAQDHTRRGIQIFQLFPHTVNSVKYGRFTSRDVLNGCPGSTSWEKIKGKREVYLSANTWVDSGNRIENWIPDLELQTDLWKHAVITEHDEENATDIAESLDYNYWVIAPSSIQNANRSGLWNQGLWAKFLKHFPRKTKFLFVGAEYDEDMIFSIAHLIGARPHEFCIGESLGTVSTLLSSAQGVICRASGLGILSESMATRTCMMYPIHEKKLIKSFASKKHIENGLYIGTTRKTTTDLYRRITQTWKQ